MDALKIEVRFKILNIEAAIQELEWTSLVFDNKWLGSCSVLEKIACIP